MPSLDFCATTVVQSINPLQIASNKLNRFYLQVNASLENPESGQCKGHLVWIWPVNILLNIVTIVMAPIVALVNLLAAAVFACLGCCSTRAKEMAKAFQVLGFQAITDSPYNSLTRLIFPSYEGTGGCASIGNYLILTPMYMPTRLIQTATAEDHALIARLTTSIRNLSKIIAQGKHYRRCKSEGCYTELSDEGYRAFIKIDIEGGNDLSKIAQAILCYERPQVLIEALDREVTTWNEGLTKIQNTIENPNPSSLPVDELALPELKDRLFLNESVVARAVSQAFCDIIEIEGSSTDTRNRLQEVETCLVTPSYPSLFQEPTEKLSLISERDEPFVRLNALWTTAWDDSLQITETRH